MRTIFFLLCGLTSAVAQTTVAQTNSPVTETDPATWTKNGFQEPVIRIIHPEFKAHDGVPVTHEFSVTAVVLRNSKWSADEVADRMDRISEMYAQCGVKLASVKLVEVGTPSSLNLDDTVTDDEATELNLITPPTVHPVMYYLKYLATMPDYFSKPPACSINEDGDERPYRRNTIYISSEAKRPVYMRQARKTGSFIDGHELGHVLTNSGHWMETPNFLAGMPDSLNGIILPEQCKLIRGNPLVREVGK